MRKILGSVLALVGGFLVVLGLLAQFYAPGRLAKTPIDVASTTYLDGTVQLSDGEKLVEYPAFAISVTHSDSELSDDEVVSWQNSTCLVKAEGGLSECVSADDPQDRLVSASTDMFATDRVTALAVNDPQYVPAEAEEKEGLVNKWPFGAEKKTYPYWDSMKGEAVDIVFDRVEQLDGLETYVYRMTQSGVPIEIADGVPGTLEQEKEVYVEPVTGSIVNQVDHQERLDEAGDPVIVIDLAFTDSQVETSVEDAKANADRLNLLTGTLPIICYAVGIPLLLIGLVLLVMAFGGRKRRGSTA